MPPSIVLVYGIFVIVYVVWICVQFINMYSYEEAIRGPQANVLHFPILSLVPVHGLVARDPEWETRRPPSGSSASSRTQTKVFRPHSRVDLQNNNHNHHNPKTTTTAGSYHITWTSFRIHAVIA